MTRGENVFGAIVLLLWILVIVGIIHSVALDVNPAYRARVDAWQAKKHAVAERVYDSVYAASMKKP